MANQKILYLFLLLFCCLQAPKLHADYSLIHTKGHNHGMFSTMNLVLGQISRYDNGDLGNIRGLKVDFGKKGLYYDRVCGENWWSYFFLPLSVGKRTGKPIPIRGRDRLKAFHAHGRLNRKQASALVRKHIRIKPHIQKEVDAFVNKHFKGLYTIGIHYRGTDKSTESPRLEYGHVIEAVQKHTPSDEPYVIFVASDEEEFVEAMKEEFPDRVVVKDAFRSSGGGSGIHFSGKRGYLLGKEALLDALLLSRTNLLIRTSSNLSLWSTYFEESLPVVLLNKRYANFHKDIEEG